MSVLDNIDGAPAAAKPGTLPASEDELVAMFIDETEHKEKGSDLMDEAVYPDFAAPEPSTYAPEPRPSAAPDDAMPGVDADAPGVDGEKVLMSLAQLPVETIVDAADTTLTELVVRGCKLEDYDGPDGDKLITTGADRAALITATERYLESQSIRVTPLTGLLVTAGLIYGKKLMYGMKLKKLMTKTAAMESELAALRRENARMADELRSRGAMEADDNDITEAVWYEA